MINVNFIMKRIEFGDPKKFTALRALITSVALCKIEKIERTRLIAVEPN